MKYKWILFDADETLFEFHSFQGLKNVMAKYNMDFTHDDYTAFQNINQPMWLAFQQQQVDVHTLKTQRFQHLSEKTGEDPLNLHNQLMTEMSLLSPALDGTLTTLEQLHQKVKMGIITNGFTSMQQPRLDLTKTSHFFDLLVISEEVGIPKPQSGIFTNAFEQMQQNGSLQKKEILMVGDSLTSDIAGGNNFGFDTCWLNRHNAENHSEIKPTFEINNLTELLPIVTLTY